MHITTTTLLLFSIFLYVYLQILYVFAKIYRKYSVNKIDKLRASNYKYLLQNYFIEINTLSCKVIIYSS